MKDCPHCSESLLRHIEHGRIYYYCPNCREPLSEDFIQRCDRVRLGMRTPHNFAIAH